MGTRTTCITRNATSPRQRLKSILVLILGVAIAVGKPVRATEAIVATGDPNTDFEAIQSALDTGGEVVLRNGPGGEIFDLNGIKKCLSITANVRLMGQDDAAGHRAKIIANNNNELAIKIDNPGGIVEFSGLDIESASIRIIMIGNGPWPSVRRDACKDLTVKDCNIVGTHGQASCIETWGGLAGTLYLEDNYIAGHWCTVDWGLLTGSPSDSKWEIHSNTFVATQSCLETSNKGLRIDNNRCEGPSILLAAGIQGEIVVTNNIMLQSGYYVYDNNNAVGLFVSHWDGFRGGEISRNTIDMNPSNAVELAGVPAISLADYVTVAWRGAHGLLIQDNTITGQADAAIWLDNGASDNIIRRNNLENFTAVRFSESGAIQMGATATCHDNVFRGNIIGALGSGAFAAVACWGDNNDFIRNDYTQSNAPGLTAGGIPCVWLASSYDPETGNLVAEPENNLVFESDGLPPGTTIEEQVLDDSREQTGTTTNIVVGHY
jgi:hypothetical protein